MPIGAQQPIEDVGLVDELAIPASGRILLIDDEAALRAALVEILSDYETVEAASGAEAIEVLRRDQAFDLIVCDMMMSDLSGMDLHEWLTENHPVLAEHFVFITGGVFTARAREYLKKVDNTALEKPFALPTFLKVVTETMARGKSDT